MTAEVKVFNSFCPYCVRAKSLLERKGVAFTEINLDEEAPEVKTELIQKTRTVQCHNFY
jgi:glutaredoxin 3